MTDGMLAREARERKEKWGFLADEVGALLDTSSEFAALARAAAYGEEDFGEFERGLREAVLSGTGAGLSAALTAADAEREAPDCAACGSAMRRRATRELSPLSLFGVLTLRRGYWTCGCTKGGWHPLDAALGVGGRGVRATAGALRALGRLAAEASYAKTAALFGEVAGVPATAKRAERCARQLGREIAAADGSDGSVAAAPAGTMCCSPDGTGVPVRPGDAGTGKDGGESKTREAKVLAFYAADAGGAEAARPEREAGSALCSAAIDSAESKDTDREPSEFAVRAWSAARRFGFAAAERRVVVADGAKWIWNTAEELFPDAVQIVDVWHAKERLWEVGRSLHGQGTERCRRWSEEVCAALDAGRTGDVLEELRRHGDDEAAAKCAGYVEANRHRMRYPEFRAMGLPVGSGMVESACGTLVGERLKCGGMRWSVAGANDVLALRACVRNDRYDAFWRRRRRSRGSSAAHRNEGGRRGGTRRAHRRARRPSRLAA